MKKNKNEKNDLFKTIRSHNNEPEKSGNEENLSGEHTHFPMNEELYLNAEELSLQDLLNSSSFSDTEEKQNENNPNSEMTDYPIIPFLVNLKPDNSHKGISFTRNKILSKESGENYYHSQGGNSNQDSSDEQKDNL